MCGGIGAYSLALPVSHWVSEFTARLGTETLDLLLRPVSREDGAADGVPLTLAAQESRFVVLKK